MNKRGYIYTRVSTALQVDGYSLDAQIEKLKEYAKLTDMIIVREYSDEGKLGRNVEDRHSFLQMMDDIKNQTDKIDFVLVFKLSRFGRNTADILKYDQEMQDFGVNLFSWDEKIDSSIDSGKLMISVPSAVSEIERDIFKNRIFQFI